MSNIREDIRQQINQALKEGNKERTSVLRMVSAEVGKLEIEKKSPLTEADFNQLLGRMRKQHQASMDQFKQAGRDDLYQQEASEKAIVESLLPQQLSHEELAKIIEEAIKSSGTSSPKEMGKVMAQLKENIAGKADMAEVSKIVKEKLSSA